MSVAISWANKMQLAKCDIMVGFPISSHIKACMYCVFMYVILYVYALQARSQGGLVGLDKPPSLRKGPH